MTKKEIQQIMAIVRPAIIALYGRQPLKIATYRIGLIYANTTRRYQIDVSGKNGNLFFVELVDDKNKMLEVTEVRKYVEVD